LNRLKRHQNQRTRYNKDQTLYILAKPADRRTDDDERDLDSLQRLSMEYETDIADLRASLAWARKLSKEATKADKDLRKSKKMKDKDATNEIEQSIFASKYRTNRVARTTADPSMACIVAS
jgi:hypothetical protein